MKKWVFIFGLICCVCGHSQSTYEFTKIEESQNKVSNQLYDKDVKTYNDRSFDSSPNSKYSGKEFDYNDNIKAKNAQEINEPETTRNSGVSLFPLNFIILIVIGVLAVAAILYKSDFSYFKMSKYRMQDEDELLSIDEDIDPSDYKRLLEKAIREQNFRLATRYYYLSLLRKLSQKNYIEYHKDKTNSEYLFELEEDEMRSGFSYLSYIYSYVWYGEFPVDQVKFSAIEEKYESFMNRIK